MTYVFRVSVKKAIYQLARSKQANSQLCDRIQLSVLSLSEIESFAMQTWS